MLLKPRSCIGCPFYGDGRGFVPDEPPGKPVIIMMQGPGRDEEIGRRIVGYTGRLPDYEPCSPKPAIGVTGYVMDRRYLPLAGLTRDDVTVMNVIKCRPNHRDTLPPIDSPLLREAALRCLTLHSRPLSVKTKLIVAQGELALWATTGEGLQKNRKLGDWRGYVLPYSPRKSNVILYDVWTPKADDSTMPVLATYHLAYMFKDPTAAIYSRKDWSKVPLILAGQWPQKPPEVHHNEPFVSRSEFAFDTEYNPETRERIRWSYFDGQHCYVTERDYPQLLAFPVKPMVIVHNALADLDYLEDLRGGIDLVVEDTMYAHSVLWSGLPHDLNSLGSLYAPFNRWKHLCATSPIVYSGLDAAATWYVWEALERELYRDPLSLKVYREMQTPLIEVIRKSQSKGMRCNQERAIEEGHRLLVMAKDLNLQAEAMAGWPINIKSGDQIKKQLYDIEGVGEWL